MGNRGGSDTHEAVDEHQSRRDAATRCEKKGRNTNGPQADQDIIGLPNSHCLLPIPDGFG